MNFQTVMRYLSQFSWSGIFQKQRKKDNECLFAYCCKAG